MLGSGPGVKAPVSTSAKPLGSPTFSHPPTTVEAASVSLRQCSTAVSQPFQRTQDWIGQPLTTLAVRAS